MGWMDPGEEVDTPGPAAVVRMETEVEVWGTSVSTRVSSKTRWPLSFVTQNFSSLKMR